ncbi:MAG TPA: ABC transporter ATP-binding protein [Bryobacteraceae bacterium]|nr:ABC transporter ATP-binding protein [Bryobacteraceae bacterium]
MSSEYAIETSGLTKVFRTRWKRREVRAVDGISLNVQRGATYGLLGPNGAGKTTFVKMLLSAVHPTAGSAMVFGHPVSDPEARRPIGYLPENHRFPTYFTGTGMLDFYAALSGVESTRRKQRIPELLEQVGLDKWGDVRIGKYSKGMLQRLGLAQALMHEPSLLILDEPSDGVDPVGRRHIREILTALEEKGVTIFINSHLLVEVELFCHDVAILHQGKVALSGRVRDLTAGKGYRLTAAQVPEQLHDRLGKSAAASPRGDGLVDFQFSTREEVNQAVDLLRAEKCEIEAVVPTTSTLEEVFVKTVDK